MIERTLLITWFLMLAEFTSSAATGLRPGWRIEREEVAEVIAQATNSKIECQELEVLGEAVAREPHPALRLESWHRNIPLEAVEFRLRCTQRSRCGEFLARYKPDSKGSAEFETAEKDHRARVRTGSKPVAWARQGRPAKMAWEGNGFRLWIPVMCMQSGGLGDRIRVRDRQGRKFFLAKVTGIGEVEAITE